jgi:hypothetical protein
MGQGCGRVADLAGRDFPARAADTDHAEMAQVDSEATHQIEIRDERRNVLRIDLPRAVTDRTVKVAMLSSRTHMELLSAVETTWMVTRISVAWTTERSSSARVRSSRANPARRVQRPT